MSTPRTLDLPAGVSRIRVETRRGVVAALEASPATGVFERLPAVLVPGYIGSKEDFLAILDGLARPGRRVLAIDLPGQYESAGPPEPSAYTLESLADVVAAVVETLDDGVAHVLGHSFGGLVARELALADSELLASCTLMSSGPAAIDGTRAAELRRTLEFLRTSHLDQLWQNRFEPDVTALELPPPIVAFLRERLLATSPVGLLSMGDQLLSCTDRVDELAKVELPLLVLYGEDDDAWHPEAQARMAERLDARQVCIPGAAHSPAVEAPETTTSALVDFWRTAEMAARRLDASRG